MSFISINELENLLTVAQDADFITLEEYEKFWDLVDRLPSADRPTGEWVKISPARIYECSVCEQIVMTDDIDCYSYCPNCGAKMEVEHDDR